MSAFHQKNWTQRVTQMGDQAENACDLVHHGKTHTLGLNRIWQNGDGLYLNDMTDAMRYTPDRLSRWCFIECMGIGRDNTLKIKQEKLEALNKWSKLGPTELFVYSSAKNVWWQDATHTWQDAAQTHGELLTFPEGKHYWALHTDHFPTDPQTVPDNEDVFA